MEDSYRLIAAPVVVETKVKGSRFIGETFLVATPEEALEKIEAVRKREYAATHHCYAWITGLPYQEMLFKYSDDGEPNGTAGRPIYDVVAGSGITNVLVVVTRYFGGTKLGTGGLTHAYSDAARAVLAQSGSMDCFVMARFRLVLPFALYDRWRNLIARIGAKEIEAQFGEAVTITAEIRSSHGPQLLDHITELTSGKGTVESLGTH